LFFLVRRLHPQRVAVARARERDLEICEELAGLCACHGCQYLNFGTSKAARS
jgi:hypothetical protein